LKILVALIACCLGAISHFYPIPFPQNKPLLAGCVLGYVICATLYYLIERRLEGDAFYLSGKHNMDSLKVYQKVRFSSDIDTSKKQEAWYVIKVQARTENNDKKIEVEKRYDLSTLYDEGGYLHRYKVKEAVEEVLKKLANSPR
jgi:hypothetical protein